MAAGAERVPHVVESIEIVADAILNIVSVPNIIVQLGTLKLLLEGSTYMRRTHVCNRSLVRICWAITRLCLLPDLDLVELVVQLIAKTLKGLGRWHVQGERQLNHLLVLNLLPGQNLPLGSIDAVILTLDKFQNGFVGGGVYSRCEINRSRISMYCKLWARAPSMPSCGYTAGRCRAHRRTTSPGVSGRRPASRHAVDRRHIAIGLER